MKDSYTAEQVRSIESQAYKVGLSAGHFMERKKIIERLKYEASEWLSHHGTCDCRVRGLEVERLIEIIEGELS